MPAPYNAVTRGDHSNRKVEGQQFLDLPGDLRAEGRQDVDEVFQGLLEKFFLANLVVKARVGGVMLAMPLVGQLMVESAMYRFASNIALLLKSGIPMIETLHALEGIFHENPIYRDGLARVQGRVAAGQPLAMSLAETGLFTTMMTNMVRIGEGSGQLADVMDQIAPYYKEKMESLVSKVTKLMEPLIIVGMGVTIAGLMMSIYMPMFEMAGKVH